MIAYHYYLDDLPTLRPKAPIVEILSGTSLADYQDNPIFLKGERG